MSDKKLIFNNRILGDWLSTKEAAQYLRTTEAFIRVQASNGKIPYYKYGRRNLYRREELKALVMSQPKGMRDDN